MTKHEAKIIKDFEAQAEKIIEQMYKVVYRTQRKIEDKAYRDVLEKVEN